MRQGANSITTFEILPQPPNSRGLENPWPQYPKVFKVDYGHEEVIVKHGGDPRRFNTQSKEFLVDENGRVSGIKTTLGKYICENSNKKIQKLYDLFFKFSRMDQSKWTMEYVGSGRF